MAEELAAGLLRPGYVIENLVEEVVGSLSGMTVLDDGLGTILDVVMRLLAAREAYVLLRSGDQLRLRASRGLYQSLASNATVPMGVGIEGWVAQHGTALAVAAAASDPRFRDLPGRTSPVGALLAQPLKMRGEVIGVLVAARQERGDFSDMQRRWLTILAQIAAVAIENDRLLDRERHRSQQSEVLLSLASLEPSGIDDFLQRLAQAVLAATSVDLAEVVLVDHVTGKLVSHGLAGDSLAERARRITLATRHEDGSFIAHIFASGQPLLCNETYDDPRARFELAELGIRSLLGAPILVDGQPLGVIHLATTRPDSFVPDDLSFLTLIADRVGLQLKKLELAERRTEVERQQAQQRARADFTAIVSHELKTPVAVIRAYNEVLLRRAEKDGGDPATVDVLSRIEEQATRMLAMIEQLLDLQRIEGGVLLLERSRFDLGELTRHITEELQVTTNRHQLRVDVGGAQPVLADRRRLEEVLHNLLGNAIKYSPRGGPIAVRVFSSTSSDAVSTPAMKGDVARYAVVEVADKGIGIAARDRPRIFERFYQAAGTPYKGRVGLGLGLYISKEIVTRHGGQMWVEAELGTGSHFYFTVPLADPLAGD